MRIVMHTPNTRIGGGVQHILRLMAGLRRRGWDAHVHSLAGSASPDWAETAVSLTDDPDGDVVIFFGDETINENLGRKKILFVANGHFEKERENLRLPVWDAIWVSAAQLLALAPGAVVVPPGVDPRYQPPEIPQERHIIGLFGSFRARKGTHAGVLAARSVSGIELRGYGRRCDDAVSFDVYLTDPPINRLVSLYQSCGIWVMPSAEEGAPLSPIEAAACGAVPVSLPGYDFPSADAGIITSDLAEGIRQLVEDGDLWGALRARAIPLAQAMTWDRSVDAAEASLRCLLS